jgi:hypothetical protein
MTPLAIVRARLPYIDQRSLSEAWFSALHLARQRDNGMSTKRGVAQSPLLKTFLEPGTRGGATGRSRSCELSPERGMRERRQEVSRALPRWQSEAVVETGPSRRLAFTRLGRTLDARQTSDARANFSIALEGGGRVQILLRREGRVLHVIALCSARHVGLVRRALACADLHLRLSGERVSSSVRVR